MFCPYCGQPAGAVVEYAHEEPGMLDKLRHSAERLLGTDAAPAPA